ncbi:hypothetical protein ATY35_20795 [Vibrio cidicii]|uniref:Outer membrane protein beta-barrel domain-containing protein n=1 Tax=Vibrio cidicii TaxID=1763883 RepID=A0ABR5W661_9VIBR|nr:outer membrane beta-barrel protein [Vibrio cidicii]KYN90701.1 hypothetical protein ATY35_20795 [Vibrio cidicii]
MKNLTLATLALTIISANSFAASMPFDINTFTQMFSGQSNFYATGVTGLTDYDETDDIAFVAGGRVGIEFNPYLAAELGYVKMGEVDMDDTGDATLETSTILIGLKPTLPVGNFIDVYGRLGLHTWDADATHRLGGTVNNGGTDFMYGAGVDLRFSGFSFGVGYTKYTLEDIDVGNYELNITYRM